jgi:uncharacterized OsmC-like protein
MDTSDNSTRDFHPSWKRAFDAEDIIEPTIDPSTQKQTFRDVVGVNFGGTRTEVKVREFDIVATDEPATSGGTNTAPTPFENLLASLVGCEGAILNGVAKAMDFEYEGVDFKAGGTFDMRGPRGVAGVRPYFEHIEVEIIIHTDEPAERVRQLARNVETRCPVMNLFRDAGTSVVAEWKIAGSDEVVALQ